MIHISTADAFRAIVLPGPGGNGGVEGLHLEYKRLIDNPRKLAVRIASMANAEGGTIIVGVTDDGGAERSRATGFYPIVLGDVHRTLADAVSWIDGNAYAPAPKHLTVDGRDIVAVHVSASPALASVPKAQNRNSAIEYPVRTIDQTVYLTAEQVEMRISSYADRTTRLRIEAFLGQVPAAVTLMHIVNANLPGDLAPDGGKVTAVVDELLDHAMRLKLTLSSSPPQTAQLDVPYDWVRRMWAQGDPNGPKFILIAGVIAWDAPNRGGTSLPKLLPRSWQ